MTVEIKGKSKNHLFTFKVISVEFPPLKPSDLPQKQ